MGPETDKNRTQIVKKMWSREQTVVERWLVTGLPTATVVNDLYWCSNSVFLGTMMGDIMCHSWMVSAVNDFLNESFLNLIRLLYVSSNVGVCARRLTRERVRFQQTSRLVDKAG